MTPSTDPSETLQQVAAAMRGAANGQPEHVAGGLTTLADLVDWLATLDAEELAQGVRTAGLLLSSEEDFVDEDQYRAFELASAVASQVSDLRLRG